VGDTLDASQVGANLALVEDAARTVRRMAADESYNADGVRTIWHRGRRIELLSWESKDEVVVRQELTFFGFHLEYRKERGLRTGVIPVQNATTDPGLRQESKDLRLDSRLKPQTLDFASQLLKSIPGRDFYAQHLLKYVNHAITVQGFDSTRTEVTKLTPFSKAGPVRRAAQATLELANPARRMPAWLLSLVLVAAGLGIGIGLMLLLLGR
jgi:hypothetical protein